VDGRNGDAKRNGSTAMHLWMGTDTTEKRAHRETTEWNILLIWKCLGVTRNNLVVVGDIQNLEITVLLIPASDPSAGRVGGAEEAELSGTGQAE
jgi:hypothetical protein